VGIDTLEWQPSQREKTADFLVYDKVRWDRAKYEAELIQPILARIGAAGFSHRVFKYGDYEPADYRAALQTSRAMLFLCSHESQGIACGEAMAAGVPIFAWDPGYCMDPERFKWGDPDIPATSVPFFDPRCGRRFVNFGEFDRQLPEFIDSLGRGGFAPRDYIMENLTVEKCSQNFVDILHRYLG
jgi:glycosyltransferase involved in cell wall biosynthesis